MKNQIEKTNDGKLELERKTVLKLSYSPKWPLNYGQEVEPPGGSNGCRTRQEEPNEIACLTITTN